MSRLTSILPSGVRGGVGKVSPHAHRHSQLHCTAKQYFNRLVRAHLCIRSISTTLTTCWSNHVEKGVIWWR